LHLSSPGDGNRPVKGRRSACRHIGAVVAGIVAASGCVSDLGVTAVDQTVWEADLHGGLEHPDVSGTAAAVTTGPLTQVGIGMSGLAPGTYGWLVREGSCELPGSALGGEGQFPELEADAPEGPEPTSVAAETEPFRAVMESGGAYHVEVRDDASERVACGDFSRR
jgi:hypothetical protein